MSNNSRRLIVCSVGDTTANAEAEKTFTAIANEKPDIFRFLGDTSYNDNDGTGWNELIDKSDIKSIMQMLKGNHEDKEEDAEKCGEDHEIWFKDIYDLKGNNWLSSKQVKNAYFIAMNSQDLDYSYVNRTQYKWVKNEIDKAIGLRNEGKIDWTFIGVHKPQYTLKTKHIPEQKARDIYQPIFDEAQVDIVESGHNHDSQLWLPLQYGGINEEPKQLYDRLPDGTFDFSKQHGQFYMINGAGGRGLTKFDESEFDENGKIANSNVMFAQYVTYAYTVYYIEGKKLTMQFKSNNGKILHEVKITK